MFDRSLAGGYAAIGAIFHVDPYAEGEPWVSTAAQFLDGTLEYAAEHDIPIWTAQDWLRFWETRCTAQAEAVNWEAEGNRLSFTVESAATSYTLTVLLPDDQDGRPVAEARVDGKVVSTGRRTVGGVNYTTLEMPAGAHQIGAIYAGQE
jgi:hypothetical protein